MTRFDDELDYACAWGRWRIGQALNEPVLSSSGERQGVDDRLLQRVVPKPAPRNGAARGAFGLRLVTDAGRPVSGTPRPVR